MTDRAALAALTAEVVVCRRCPRLVAWREEVAREKVSRFRDDTYWGRPVPGFGDPDARIRAYRAFDEIMHLAIGLGGTITGEHGVGRAKKAALPAQLGPEVMALSFTIKKALDPLGILNPGAIF